MLMEANNDDFSLRGNNLTRQNRYAQRSGGWGVTPRKLGRGVRPASQKPYPNSCYSLRTNRIRSLQELLHFGLSGNDVQGCHKGLQPVTPVTADYA